MNTLTTTVSPPAATTTRSRTHVDASAVTAVTATGFLVGLAGLHVLKPDLSPTWRMVSEYEIGRHGWIMQIAFVLLAVSCVAARSLLRPVTPGRAGRVGRGALLVTAARALRWPRSRLPIP
jgi:hypothetical protein